MISCRIGSDPLLNRWPDYVLHPKRLSAFLLMFAFMAAPHASAQSLVYEYPLEPALTTSPKATLQTFMQTFREGYEILQQNGMRRSAISSIENEYLTNRIVGCLDLREVPPALRHVLADEASTNLKEVLDRIELPPESEWPDEERVAEDEITRWTIPHTEITIALIEVGPKKGQFQFTPDTIERATEFYDRVKHLPYVDRPTTTPNVSTFFYAEPGSFLPRSWIKSLPAWAHERPGGQAVWQWFGLVIVLIVAVLLMLTAYLVGMRNSRWARKIGVFRYLLTIAFPLAAMAVPLLARSFVQDQLRITGGLLVGLTYFFNVLFLFAAIVLVLGSSGRVAAVVISIPKFKPGGMDAQFVNLACRVLSIVAAVVIMLEGGQQIGIPLTTLLAGAGVGGLAFALAAQDMLKNVFGTIMISLDKPYRVGERIVVKGYDGVVESVGLRSTKIRMLTGHLTTIPNEEMARCDIENIGRRPSIRRISDIPVPLDTPPDKIAKAVDIVRKILQQHDGVHEDFPPRVFFNDFNRDSFNIRMMLWFHPANYWDFLAFSQDVNQKIVEQFEAEGIPFALPTNLTYLAQTDDSALRPADSSDDG